jgi:hypothetical protein
VHLNYFRILCVKLNYFWISKSELPGKLFPETFQLALKEQTLTIWSSSISDSCVSSSASWFLDWVVLVGLAPDFRKLARGFLAITVGAPFPPELIRFLLKMERIFNKINIFYKWFNRKDQTLLKHHKLRLRVFIFVRLNLNVQPSTY